MSGRFARFAAGRVVSALVAREQVLRAEDPVRAGVIDDRISGLTGDEVVGLVVAFLSDRTGDAMRAGLVEGSVPVPIPPVRSVEAFRGVGPGDLVRGLFVLLWAGGAGLPET